MRIFGLMFLLLTTGCVGVERAPSPAHVPSTPPQVIKPEAEQSTEDKPSAKVEAPATQSPTIPPPSTVSSAPRQKPPAAPRPEKPAPTSTAPAMDLTMLENRLKETKAIGVFTKLTLKNQVDDLLDQFRGYYQGKIKITLAELRQPYDRLLLKVLTLLQEGDPELARAILASREAIWSILADPAKFATL